MVSLLFFRIQKRISQIPDVRLRVVAFLLVRRADVRLGRQPFVQSAGRTIPDPEVVKLAPNLLAPLPGGVRRERKVRVRFGRPDSLCSATTI